MHLAFGHVQWIQHENVAAAVAKSVQGREEAGGMVGEKRVDETNCLCLPPFEPLVFCR